MSKQIYFSDIPLEEALNNLGIGQGQDFTGTDGCSTLWVHKDEDLTTRSATPLEPLAGSLARVLNALQAHPEAVKLLKKKRKIFLDRLPCWSGHAELG